ncbi:class I SAM-dependent methyltransferase [Clostridium tagluense]|uniref:class I SAM-dependent methyltransferase n=1 Tax=Clostridium tagluense TaxID=360422 RepID=UPI001C0D4F1C|nr:methyltransferase domain-containing protein [Clostridium tagluense]MBU3128648.1 class I SAM-dependent methyltransferase [Clostridium tagluense]
MNKDSDFSKNQSEVFDLASDYYDKFRPSYPQELINCIISETGIKTDSTILEIGAGSGKATELFVNKGFNMYCIEPGENLAAVALKKFGPTRQVEYCTCRLEDWKEKKDYFHLAISAQAFHWVPKPIGFLKCASALKSKGFIGLFWNLYLTYNEPIDAELSETGMFLLQSEASCEERIKSHTQEIKSSGCFKEAIVYRFPWSQIYTADEYIGFMKTCNGYLSASENDRQAAEVKVREIINGYGGFIVRQYLCVLFLAQKR